MINPWWQYLVTHLGGEGATQAKMAARAGFDQTAFSRWKGNSKPPPPETVIRVARNIERSPVEALVAAGWLSPTEADVVEVRLPAREPSNEELLEIIRARIEGSSHGNTTPEQEQVAGAGGAAGGGPPNTQGAPGSERPSPTTPTGRKVPGRIDPTGLYAAEVAQWDARKDAKAPPP